jgi:uncharacterized protein YeaO (DUF488 family)
MAILLKNVRLVPTGEDGVRVLVERRRPSGMKKDSPKLDAWLPALAPSDELQRWFNTRPSQWVPFRRDYLAELSGAEAEAALRELEAIVMAEAVGGCAITLLTAAKDEERSHAAVLRDLLEGVRKPPATSGPARAAAGARVRARRRF